MLYFFFFQGMPDYRLSLLFRIQSLTELDRSKVSVEEKVKKTREKVHFLHHSLTRNISLRQKFRILAVTLMRDLVGGNCFNSLTEN